MSLASRRSAQLLRAHDCISKRARLAGYSTRCLQLPALLQKSGACATVTYLGEKQFGAQELLADLQVVLGTDDPVAETVSALIGQANGRFGIEGCPPEVYLLASAELLAAAEMMALFANALVPRSDTAERNS